MSGPDDVEVRWGLGDAAAGFAVAVLGSVLTGGLWLAVSRATTLNLLGMAIAQTGLWAGLLGAPVAATHSKGRGSLVDDFGFRMQGRDWCAMGIGAACQLVAVPLLYIVIQQLTGDLDVERPARELTERADGVAFVVLALLVTFVAPLIEELFYRGLVLRAAAKRYGTCSGVLISSAAFGASHFQVHPVSGPVRPGGCPGDPHHPDWAARSRDHCPHRVQRGGDDRARTHPLGSRVKADRRVTAWTRSFPGRDLHGALLGRRREWPRKGPWDWRKRTPQPTYLQAH